MTLTTPDLALPYPEGTESPDGPSQLQALAEAVEQVILDRTPTGTVRSTISSTPDTGWLMCDGGAKDKATYPDLDALLAGLGYPFGSNPTTFNVPDLRGRAPVGVDGTAGRLSANDALGDSGGEEEHLLTAAESGVRNHTHASGSLAAASHSHTSGTLVAVSHAHAAGSLAFLASTGPPSADLDLWAFNGPGASRVGFTLPTFNHNHAVGAEIVNSTAAEAPAVNGATAAASPNVNGATGNPDTVSPSSAHDATTAHSNTQPYICLHFSGEDLT